MLSLNSFFKSKPKEIKVMASNNFLESLNNISDIRVTDHEHVKRSQEPLPAARSAAPAGNIQNVIKAKPKEVKVMAAGSFLASLNNIDDIRSNRLKDRDQSREELSRTSFQEAMAIIRRLRAEKDFNLNELKIAANKLIISIENNRNNAEAYINLAIIFFVIKNIPASIKYMKISRSINPDLPEINKLQKLLSIRT
jgi:tellurite resistance protein